MKLGINGHISIIRFATPLGMISCGLDGNPASCQTEGPFMHEDGSATLCMTMPNYKIELITFKLPLGPAKNEYVTAASLRVTWHIQKLTNATDQVELYCKFAAARNIDVTFNPVHHKSLDTIEAHHVDWALFMKTDDIEAMQNSAQNAVEIPIRVKDAVSLHNPFTTIKRAGFKATVPHLKQGERLDIHYLMAYHKQGEQDAKYLLP
jgi:hypothetical protein